MAWIVDLEQFPSAVDHVAIRMREWDRREIFATRPDDDVPALCRDVKAAGKVSWAAGVGDTPIAVFGCMPMWRGVWSMWLFATDDFNKIGISVTKLVKRAIVPGLFREGAHRLECRSMEGHIDAQRWLGVIGASHEATLKGYGRDGEDFRVYAWKVS